MELIFFSDQISAEDHSILFYWATSVFRELGSGKQIILSWLLVLLEDYDYLYFGVINSNNFNKSKFCSGRI